MSEYDLFVIGGGSGGVACARRSAAYGAKVGLAEFSRVGGTCVIRGCVPKKLMHYGAHFADHFRAARAYGWELGTPGLDFRALVEARNKEIARLNGIYIRMLEGAGVELHRTRAVIAGRDGDGLFAIDAGDKRVRARRVLVAVGARPTTPRVPGIEHAVTSDEILEEVYDMPRRLAVVGGGYIGVELASIFTGLGAETTIILRRDRPLRGFDEDLRSALTGELAQAGLRFQCETTVDAIEKTGDGVALRTSAGPMAVDKVVYATGRDPRPNTDGLGLETLGVRTDATGAVHVDATYESNVAGLYAVGDCSDHAGSNLDPGRHDLTPVAIAEGRVIAETLFNNNPHGVAYGTIPTAVFGIPQAGSAGLTEAEARELDYDVAVYKTRFRPMLHTLTGEEARIFMKLVVDKPSDKVLGCHMVGDDAAEIIQGLAIALTAGASKADFDATVGVHPTAAEEFVTMYQPAED